MRLMALALSGVVAMALTAADEKDAKIRELDTKGLKLTPVRLGKATEPAVFSSKDDLAKSPQAGAAAEDIAKLVNFDKEKVAVFAWAGSGQDKLAAGEVKDKTAKFAYSRGLTRDLRRHIRLFAIPKDAEVKVEVAKQ